MGHHTHSMQGWLSIEEHIVPIFQLTLGYRSKGDELFDVFRGSKIVEVNKVRISLPYLGLQQVFDAPFLAKFNYLFKVELINLLRYSHVAGYSFRYSNLVKGKEWVRADNAPGRKVNSFSHQMLPKPTLLRC